ncbi:hypothetical protein [Aquisalinus flavus]|uniref:Uncharacterized protein n=1 Tax=Aquisalinus flavus TaxID=1526572 RepID=A0A8J2Y5A8_9PROT|nr:hypothetical protein [Aquisalinus flavus]MBD0426753.1 hypothetical protein [Aquisalinus flavus]UNE46610.1 hypothetical protein FF099_00315 [Aquisalinus flavus]GGC95714.1 hypothetical protein GCM10011342_00630 [Aquisalinus flavus]
MKNKSITSLLAISLTAIVPMTIASAQQTPATLDDAVAEFTRICMADQTQYYDSAAEASASCACSLGVAGAYLNEQDFITYLVFLQELLKFDEFGTQEHYDTLADSLTGRGFDDATIGGLMAVAEELGFIEETYCAIYW